MTAEQIVAWIQQRAAGAALCADSRCISNGDVFFAYPGDTGDAGDGRRFIADAIERGAAVVIYEKSDYKTDAAVTVPALAVIGLKQQAGAIANAWYQKPDADMSILAITGTNGKTSCSQWLAAAWSRLAGPCAVIGTLGTGLVRNGVAEPLVETGYTTPDPILLQRRLRALRDAGAQALAIEASSIGLDQGRLRGLHIHTALWTNLSRDHLDYHADMASYCAAKMQLFDWPGLQHAVINLDDATGLQLLQRLQTTAPHITLTGYSISGKSLAGIAHLAAHDLRTTHYGTTFQLTCGADTCVVKSRMVGAFNVSNLLGVIGVMLAHGFALPSIIAAIEALGPVPGRMQQCGGDDAPLVVIDYAHTPDALEKTLATLRHVARQRSGKLWCVFGCGGDRDTGKRAAMGTAAMNADEIVITSDNPRSETPSSIIAQILVGITQTTPISSIAPTIVAPKIIEDRAAAILWAIRHAERADVVLLAGKGHETTQEINGKKYPFLDADHAALALATRATNKGVHP